MSCNDDIQYWRVIQKYSTISGQEPTVPPSSDHNDGTWSDTDLYIGEVFMNVADNRIWYRAVDGIHEIGATGASGSFIGDYVPTSGGTFSGIVYAPTFSSLEIVSGLITASAFAGPQIGTSASVIYGDGSNLTGITVAWNGGTVSNPTEFDNDVMLNTFVQINGVVNGDSNGIVTFDSGIEVINGYGVSASYFIGDGSGLTNLPTGTYSDTYTTMAGLSGSTIIFDRNDLPAAYSVDLSPILMTYSISSLYWNSLTSELTIQTLDGDTFSQTINEFDSINSLSSITANDFYGGTFHGTFVGTYSNDIYTEAATLSGTELIFDRTDGASYSVDLAPIAGGGATPSLIDVLMSGNTPGTYSISSVDGNTKIYFPPAPYDPGLYIDSADPGNYIAQLQIKKLNGVVAAHTDLNTGAGSSIDMSSQNGLISSASDGAYNTQLQQTGIAVTIYGDNPTFAGAQYLADYSANYTNRSLVDKEYVDNMVAASDTLSEVLSNGNETGVHDIILTNSPFTSTSDSIKSLGNTLADAKFSFEDLGSGTEWAPTMRVDDADTQNYITVAKTDTYIHSSQVGGLINRYSQVKLNNGPSANVEISSQNLANGEYSLIRTRVDGNIVLENHEGVRIEFYPQMLSTDPKNIIIAAPDEFILQGGDMKIIGATGGFAGIKYNADYSSDYTNRSLVDKEYVDGAVAGAGGTLEETLALGNSTGTHSIYIGSSASKIEGYNGVSQHWYNATNPFFGDYFQIENGTGTSASFIKMHDDASGAIHLANNNAWDLTSNDAGRTSIYMGGNTQILSENRDFAGNTFHVKTNATMAPNGSTTETRDMISDTSAMVSTYTDGAGTDTNVLIQAYHNGGLKAGQIYVYEDKVNLKAEENGVSFTNIELSYTDITVSGTPSFGGMKYDRDYSANYTNRSLVDKEYVDSHSGSGGLTWSGLTDSVAYFNTSDSISYTNMLYNSGRWTMGNDTNVYPFINYARLAIDGNYTGVSDGVGLYVAGDKYGAHIVADGQYNGGQMVGLQVETRNSQITGNLGIYSLANGTQSCNIGGYFVASGGTLYPGYSGFDNLGLDIYVTSQPNTGAGVTNSGISIIVTGRPGDSNYIGKFQDGSEGVGKVLTCVSADGLATWQSPTGGIGATGATGATGPAGATGATGPAGSLGTYSVIDVFGITGSNYTTLNATASWDIDGQFIGSALSGAYQGQMAYSYDYLFVMVADNTPIRLIRG